MLARQRAQREQPLLDLLRARAGRARAPAPRRSSAAERLGGLGGGALGRGERAVEQALGAVAGAFEPPQRPRQRRLRAALAVDLADRLGDRLAQPLGVLQQSAAGGEAVLLVGFGRQRIEFGMVVAQQILLGAAFGEQPRRLGGARRARRASRARPRRARPARCRRSAKASSSSRCVGRVEQAVLLALALDLDEAVAELAQQADAGRLVVDKGAAAAVGGEQCGAG